ncbi:hypothetical protein HPNQ4044_0622 [Helicobacter pylori NQ4044]|uniref:Uncharacterized protein n=1 Tax=Helicobacter pylori NQ4044 TaxID=992028 RepID=I9ZKK6_HELPX|nr:hypothetical protein HPNQ4044_0622 [Helicobacter pylori NQ4044]
MSVGNTCNAEKKLKYNPLIKSRGFLVPCAIFPLDSLNPFKVT